MRNSTRSAAVVAAAAAGLMALGAPAFAASPMGGHESVHHNHEANGVTAGDDNDIQVPIGACNNNVAAVIAAVVPVLSPQTVGHCSTAVIDQH